MTKALWLLLSIKMLFQVPQIIPIIISLTQVSRNLRTTRWPMKPPRCLRNTSRFKLKGPKSQPLRPWPKSGSNQSFWILKKWDQKKTNSGMIWLTLIGTQLMNLKDLHHVLVCLQRGPMMWQWNALTKRPHWQAWRTRPGGEGGNMWPALQGCFGFAGGRGVAV